MKYLSSTFFLLQWTQIILQNLNNLSTKVIVQLLISVTMLWVPSWFLFLSTERKKKGTVAIKYQNLNFGFKLVNYSVFYPTAVPDDLRFRSYFEFIFLILYSILFELNTVSYVTGHNVPGKYEAVYSMIHEISVASIILLNLMSSSNLLC